jgi:hypothetical protein
MGRVRIGTQLCLNNRQPVSIGERGMAIGDHAAVFCGRGQLGTLSTTFSSFLC